MQQPIKSSNSNTSSKDSQANDADTSTQEQEHSQEEKSQEEYKLHFYATSPYECSYLPHHEARSQVVTPCDYLPTEYYTQLIHMGFRRSGNYIYRPYCDHCKACLSLRIRVNEFKPNRSQKRAWQLHQNNPLTSYVSDLVFFDEHFELYQRYQKGKHADSSMAQDDKKQYAQFLLESNVNTQLVEFRDDKDVLKMVSLIDQLEDGLSSVYTFYDPEEPAMSFGTYNVLWQIRLCQSLGLPFLYLGYWIAQCQKMSYKNHFKPHDIFQNGHWVAAKD